jgi:hypothetical protein
MGNEPRRVMRADPGEGRGGDVSDTTEDRGHRRIESLSLEEGQAVHEWIRTVKERSSGEDERPPSAPAIAARRGRAARADRPDALPNTISEERRDRV